MSAAGQWGEGPARPKPSSGKAMLSVPVSGGKGNADAPTATGETYAGVVKSFSETNNYGFVSSEEVSILYGGDCFASGKVLAGWPVGSEIEFDVGLSKAGKPQAIAIRP